jgi:Mu-like prophage I protein
MPYEIVPGSSKCDSKPFAVIKQFDGHLMGCHDTRHDALQQLAALYAAERHGMSEGGIMGVTASYVIDTEGLVFDEANGVKTSWVHALPLGQYKHPLYGTIDISAERAKNFADGVKAKIRGIDPSINYVHDNNNVAAGWVKNAENRVDGVWLFVEWVSDAAKQISEKKWRYFSAEYADEWEDPQGKKFKDVILGGALTNRPFMKNLVPLNLSEATYETAFELVSIITGQNVDSLKGGNNVQLSEDDIKKIVEGLAVKLSEGKPNPPTPEPQKSLMDIPELKALAAENEMVALLVKTVENQNVSLADSAKTVKLAEINARLKDFDNSKVIVTPVARQLIQTLAEKLPDGLLPDFWTLLTEMKKGTSFLVELGERAGASVNYGSQKSAYVQLQEIATKIQADKADLSATDAFDAAAMQNPQLYTRYRTELLEGVAN